MLVSLERGDRSELQPAAVVHGRRSALGRLDEGVSRGIADELVATTSPLNLETSAELDALPRIAAIGRVRSLYAIPLSDTEDAEQGAAALLFASERGLPGYRHPLLQAHVDQAAQALGRVRRHEHEHNLAVLLQESLLPKTLPETEGLSLGAYYRAGAVNTEVGGDWYDVVRRADGILQLTVGDVAGRGIEAAIAMSQLRSAFRAYALDHASPGAIVERLGRHVESDGMATVVCVAYDPFTRELTYAVAGHLPPLLRDAGALEVSRLDTTATGPLGWTASPSAADTRLTVPDGTLALYTDGLVEKRGRSIDEGIDRLARALEESPTASAAALVDTIVERGEAANDDIALLLLQIDGVPSRFQVELAAETQMLRELRRRVRLWLANRGVGEDAVTDAVLALNEACANAIEHAYRDGPGTIDLDLEHADDRLVMVVEDHGSWRKPTADPTRGRGLVLMQGLMHRTDVSQSQTGTRVLLQQNL